MGSDLDSFFLFGIWSWKCIQLLGYYLLLIKLWYLHPRRKPVNLRLELYHQVGSSWVLQVCHCWYTEFMPLFYSNPHWHYFIRESVVVGHIDTVLYCAVKSLMRSSCLYSRLLAKVEIPPLHITKIGVPTPLEYYKMSKLGQSSKPNQEFLETFK